MSEPRVEVSKRAWIQANGRFYNLDHVSQVEFIHDEKEEVKEVRINFPKGIIGLCVCWFYRKHPTGPDQMLYKKIEKYLLDREL